MQQLNIGTDCSGMDSPIEALKQLNIKYNHVFACDINKNCKKTILANSNPLTFYDDIRSDRKLDDIDCYVAGFPCQSFSIAGKQLGFDDIRGEIFFDCLKVIKTKNPKFFILENVKNILSHNNNETFDVIMTELKDTNYHVSYQLLNTSDYGIPQHRQRVYIVGLNKEHFNTIFVFPQKIGCDDLNNYIDYTDTSKNTPTNYVMKHNPFARIPNDSVFINLSFPKDNFPNSNRFSPCITSSALMWNVKLGRYANTNELLRLQGFDLGFKKVVSDKQFKMQIGNSMSVCVLKEIFKEIFKCERI